MSITRDSAVARLKLADPDPSSVSRIDGGEFFCEYCPPRVSLVGKSPEMIEVLKIIRLIAQSRCNPVLILGESGTGKELAARAIHFLRGGGDGDFVAVNCAALTANLLESELFGHVRGSFTGADREKTGLFEAARHGSILLDEISEMPPELQAKLLRVIQERKFRKVGGTKDIPCHATIIASSNRDLLSEVADRRFRKDLYYRLAVFPIRMPALRSEGRACDILLLARFFLQSSEVRRDRKVEGITPAAEQFLLSHDWPGNVRELRNVIDRALIIETG
ncbi:MAG: sigma 54-interacting transcriptional regulator, partial [Phycisphaerae bacterium]|nr:sigma 54-interacting transcriptional regulator [Phycisphaerae bacterium]